MPVLVMSLYFLRSKALTQQSLLDYLNAISFFFLPAMFVCKELLVSDLFKLNLVNLDVNTGSFSIWLYLKCLMQKDSPCYTVMHKEIPFGYMIGEHNKKKEEEEVKDFTHITAVSISPLTRRMGLGSAMLATILADALSNRSFFIDLFVRKGNARALSFYRKHGYATSSVLSKYYSDPEEDAYDMRKYLK